MLPAARIVDHRAPQNSRGAVEIEEVARAGTRSVLENEVAIEQHGFHFGQEIEAFIEVAPARLHHTDLGVREMVNGSQQKIGRWNEIGIEYRDKLARRALQALLKGTGLETLAIGAMQVLNRMPDVEISLAKRFGERMGIVGGIVKYLNLKQFARIFDLDHFIDQPLQHVALVIKRQLNRDLGELSEFLRRIGCRLLAVLEIGMDGIEAVHPVDRKDAQDTEIGNQDSPIEPCQLMNPRESIVEHAARDLREGRDSQQRG